MNKEINPIIEKALSLPTIAEGLDFIYGFTHLEPLPLAKPSIDENNYLFATEIYTEYYRKYGDLLKEQEELIEHNNTIYGYLEEYVRIKSGFYEFVPENKREMVKDLVKSEWDIWRNDYEELYGCFKKYADLYKP